MQWLANISVRRAVFASVLMLSIVVVGLAGYRTLGVDAFPKIDFPVVTVVTRLHGGARATSRRRSHEAKPARGREMWASHCMSFSSSAGARLG